MFLSVKDFESTIRNTPMISIDLCITNQNSLLLGKRLNPPAKDTYFVPGGRIRKSETINEALERIIYDETGRKIKDLQFLNFIGIFEHFYNDNFLGNSNFSSHYIVIAYSLSIECLTETENDFKNNQHSDYVWVNDYNKSEFNIHPYTKAYFEKINL